jgi:hypothetical protein
MTTLDASWTWLLHTDGGLLVRVAAGIAIFAWLAVLDLNRNGRDARRWREYLFLLSCVLVALAYGIVNDQLTVGISWEYFCYGKDLAARLGPKLPPDAWALRWEASKVGMKATWSAGLIIGVALLFANNPGKNRPPLPFSKVYRLLPLMAIIPAATAITLGIMGRLGWLIWANSDFPMLLKENLWRPYQFMTVYGIHLGGYVGGAIATLVSAILIHRKRCRVEPSALPSATTGSSLP